MIKLYIKNMVCKRCKMVVNTELINLGLHPLSVDLGVVELSDKTMKDDTKQQLLQRLESLGFELIEDKRKQLVDKIKTTIILMIRNHSDGLKLNLSEYLTQQLQLDYSYMSHVFSEEESVTIEKYFIAQRIEKVKEWLEYEDLLLTEIAFRLNYSSVAYLSNQFKKSTGMTPTQFRAQKNFNRKSIDDI